MSESALRAVLDRVAPSVRESIASGSFVPSSYATPLALASLALDEEHLVAVVATSSDAELFYDALVAWLGQREVALWPGWDTHPLERVSPDSLVMAQRSLLRWRIRNGTGPRMIVASARSIAQILSPESVHEPFVLARGAQIDRDNFLQGLVSRGYRREQLVEHRAEIAVRGGIVDVWPAHADEPIRLDFFGDDIERLTVFDIATQRSTHDVDEIVIGPAREWLPGERTRERAEELALSAPWAQPTFDRLASGQLFDGMEGWMELFVREPATLLDEMAGARVVVVETPRVRARLDELLVEERELTDVVAATWRTSDEVPLLHLDYDQVLEGRVSLALDARASALDSPLTSPPVVQGDASRVAAHVRGWSKARRGVILTSSVGAIERMADQLRGEGLEVTTDPARVLEVRLSVLESPLPLGFSLEEPEVVVWSESDLTGRRPQRRVARTRTRNVDGFFDDLAVGSYVVHRQHGVARFSGTTTRAINGVTRDYLILEFKDGRSYWPTEQIDALTPYTGGDSPALSRMGGVEWQKTRAKARAAAFLVAQELVDLYRLRTVAEGHAFSPDTAWQREMEELFPYTLTADQAQSIIDVKADMESPRPMDRLVCADVGFGKTEVALRAVFKAVQDNYQAAVLVPTTLLASQHFATFTERFAGFPVKVALLSRFVDDAESKTVLAGLRDGSVDVVIGTHRLLSDAVAFKKLGLLVVDEEQRFGVTHKEEIKSRSVGVDVLTLSASPIPRTLEMAFTGIRDLSMITTPPADRRPILTHVGEYNEPAVVEAIRRELLREGQVFFVHNRVTDIDQVARRLGQLVPDARIAIAHGQMDEGTLERVMIDFWERRSTCWSARRSWSRVSTCRRSTHSSSIARSDSDWVNCTSCAVGWAQRTAGLRVPLSPRGSGSLRDRLRAPSHHRRQHRPRQRLQDRHARPRDPGRGQPSRSRPVRACRGRGVRPLRATGRRGRGRRQGILAFPRSPRSTSTCPARPTCPRTTSRPTTRASRRTADWPSVTTHEELEDLRAEWVDRYGALPPSAIGLFELASCVLCAWSTASRRSW